MAKILGGLRTSRFPLATNYEDQGPDEIVFPEDLSALDDAGVDSLLNGALEAFQDIYGDGSNLSDAQVDALSALTEGITRVKGEKDGRTAASAERSASAAALAEQAGITRGTTGDPAPVVEEPAVEVPAVEEVPAVGSFVTSRMQSTGQKAMQTWHGSPEQPCGSIQATGFGRLAGAGRAGGADVVGVSTIRPIISE